MTSEPGLTQRVLAALRRQVPADAVAAYQRAGLAVVDLVLLTDARRAELAAHGTHPWDADASTASLFLATWTARVHQEFACELVEADYRDDPATAGYLPPSTANLCLRFFAPVERWLTFGRRASASSSFWIGDEADLPAALPELVLEADAPDRLLRGMLAAADVVDRRVDEVLGAVLGAGDPPARWADHLERLRELAAQAHSSLRYAQALWHPGSAREHQGVILTHLAPALVLQHNLGQFLALPELLDSFRTGPLSPTR